MKHPALFKTRHDKTSENVRTGKEGVGGRNKNSGLGVSQISILTQSNIKEVAEKSILNRQVV
jgi:hypothetical protein